VGVQSITFDDAGPQFQPLNGEYPNGVADWGSDSAWYLAGPEGGFATPSLSFTGAGPASATFTLLTPRRVLRMSVSNASSGSSTVTLACANLPTVSVTVLPRQLRTIETGWTANCPAVTMTSSSGSLTNFDNIQIQ
jgi:hypothetical protein